MFSFYRDANPGIRATVLLVVRVDETEQRLYTLTKIREAIVMAAANDTDWVVKASDITGMYAGGGISIKCVCALFNY